MRRQGSHHARRVTRTRRRGTRSGQGLVEFALVAPVLMLSVFLLIDFARLLYTFSAISSTAREGARVLSLASSVQTDC
ncbi:MAG: pilus assembly protein, partial [Candidatus Dormibacteraeota bacterium]|nr:pilus assembly protein [Candidatus Dormibacteraeota bacterium]